MQKIYSTKIYSFFIINHILQFILLWIFHHIIDTIWFINNRFLCKNNRESERSKKKFASSTGLCFNFINIKINNKSNFTDFLYITRLFIQVLSFVTNLATYKSSKIDLKRTCLLSTHCDRWKVSRVALPVRVFSRIPDTGSFPQAVRSNMRQNVPEASQAIWFGSRLADERKSFAVAQLAHALIYRFANGTRVNFKAILKCPILTCNRSTCLLIGRNKGNPVASLSTNGNRHSVQYNQLHRTVYN